MNKNDDSPALHDARAITRRYFFKNTGLGLGAMALQALLARDTQGNPQSAISRGRNPQSGNPLSPKPPMFAPKARRVIYLHMAGSPSQLELFEYKPELKKLHMKDCPPSFLEGKRFAFIKGAPKILAGQFRFERCGQSGQWISELLPHFARVVDKTCVIRTVQTDQFNHAPAQLYVHTGSPRLGGASMGSWIK